MVLRGVFVVLLGIHAQASALNCPVFLKKAFQSVFLKQPRTDFQRALVSPKIEGSSKLIYHKVDGHWYSVTRVSLSGRVSWGRLSLGSFDDKNVYYSRAPNRIDWDPLLPENTVILYTKGPNRGGSIIPVTRTGKAHLDVGEVQGTDGEYIQFLVGITDLLAGDAIQIKKKTLADILNLFLAAGASTINENSIHLVRTSSFPDGLRVYSDSERAFMPPINRKNRELGDLLGIIKTRITLLGKAALPIDKVEVVLQTVREKLAAKRKVAGISDSALLIVIAFQEVNIPSRYIVLQEGEKTPYTAVDFAMAGDPKTKRLARFDPTKNRVIPLEQIPQNETQRGFKVSFSRF
jgi:hypothetical protein